MLNQTVNGDWMDRFANLIERLEAHFSRRDLHARVQDYLTGLLAQVERKNSWQLAEAVGASSPHGFQRLLGRATWDADQVRDDLQQYVGEQIGDVRGVLIVDETGFLKKGDKSVGVSRQYSGTAGRIENSQIGVFLAYRSDRGHCLIDRELYLPKSWTDDPSRLLQAGVPKDNGFATKPALARRMIQRALNAGVQASWVTADEVYGGDSKFRELLEKRSVGYVVCVSCKQQLFFNSLRARVDYHVGQLPPRIWKRRSCGSGTKGERYYDWALIRFGVITEQGFQRGLLVRRSIDRPEEISYYFTHAKPRTRMDTLIRVAGTRWSIEECFEQAKQETGLDEYEVRSWVGWYRHITLSMFALAFLTSVRAKSASTADLKKSESRRA